MSDPNHLDKSDIERIVRDLVPPIVREVATETAKAVATETAKAVATEVSKALAVEVSKSVAEALTDSFRRFGMEPTSAEGMAKQHRRMECIDTILAERKDFQERMNFLDRVKADLAPADLSYLREIRVRHENDNKTLRETIIRYVLPLLAGVLLTVLASWVREQLANHQAVPVQHVPTRDATVPASMKPEDREHGVGASETK